MEYYKNLDLANIIYFCEYDLVWKTEQWTQIKDYECLYEVSDLGRIKSLNRNLFCTHNNSFSKIKEKILKQGDNKKGYYCVRLYKNGTPKQFKVHQLVAIAFLNHILCGMKLVVNHKNFIRSNNRVDNLEIVTSRENGNLKHIQHSSIYTGVSWHKSLNKWSSKITINRKLIHIGYFVNEIDAHNAYQYKLNEII